MKSLKLLFLFLCFCILNSYAQENNLLYHEIQLAKSSGEQFESVSALTYASKNALQSNKAKEYFFEPSEVYFLNYSKPEARNLRLAAAT